MKKLIIPVILMATILQGCCNNTIKTSDTIADKMQAPQPADVKIKGRIGKKIDTFIQERVLSNFAKEEIFPESEKAFANPIDDEYETVGEWRGEFWGKLAISASRVQNYTQDAKLKKYLKQTAYNVMSYQHDDGYIGSYKNKLFLKVDDPIANRAKFGWACPWCWNLWCRKYTLWGLLSIYETNNDPMILESARRSADQYIDMLHDNKIKICDTGTFVGMPSMSILKPMLILYRYTGDKKFLDFSKEIVSYWDRDGNPAPNFFKNIKTDKAIHEWYPEPEKWAKAYEMMSCLQGLLEYYRVTGDKKCLDTVKEMHARLWKHERNAIDGVGYNDQFANGANEINGVTETCDSIHWMRLSYELFLITGDAKYMDIFETTALNAFLAGIYRDGKWAARGVRSHTRHMTSPGQKSKFSHCCVNNVPRGFMDMAQSLAMSDKCGNVYVNLYIPATVKLGCTNVEILDGYLQNGETYITISTKSPKTVKFRIPSWSKKLLIDGKSYTGDWAEVKVDGKKTFFLKFDFTPRIVHSKLKATDYPEKSNTNWRWIASQQQQPTYALLRKTPGATIRVGPLLLARSKKIGNTEKEMFESKSINNTKCEVKLIPDISQYSMCCWVAIIKTPNGVIRTRVCDLSTANDEISDDDHLVHSIFF